MINPLSLFFSPRGVALVGASASPAKLSHGILRNLMQYGYPGGIYPVNPSVNEILGLPCYSDVASVPEPVDLAVIILPAEMTPEVVEACGRRGIKAVTIISGGFREVGAEGARLERQCLEIAHRYGMRLIGPNCVGTLDLATGLNTTFIQGLPARGRIGFVSQSGAVGGGVFDLLINKGVGFSCFASLGNEADVTETDLIEYLADDPNTNVITAYVESIRDGKRFTEVCSRVSRSKPIIVLKSGRTQAGARAVSSHTGSLAGSYTAYQAAFAQCGVIEVVSTAEMFDLAQALDYQPLPQGERVAILTNAGGPAALASDSLEANGLRVGDLEEETRKNIRSHLVASAQVGNPVDMLGGAEAREYRLTLRELLADRSVDAALAVLVPQALVNPVEVAQAIGEAAQESNKPVIACFMGDQSIGEARRRLHQHHVPMLVLPESVGSVLGGLLRYQRWLETPVEVPMQVQGIDDEAARRALESAPQGGTLGEAATRPLLEAYGIPLIAGEAARSPEEAAVIARRLKTPVALKIISPDIFHKSEVGGILLDLADEAAVVEGYRQLMQNIAEKQPRATIEGALVEAMAPEGIEVIVGMQRDPAFGALMMFGLGGVYVELFRDVSFNVAPLTRKQARQMIERTKAGRLLGGLRGKGMADIEAVVDCILRLSQMALDFPQIEEIEINPLLALPNGEGALALDGRVLLQTGA
ncbi:MAG: acetate--CoA ligase family protein [Anaerolineaceae bacterium]|nr:acetate--CoA ligase family protein [Anaerolineaceae bacterium]